MGICEGHNAHLDVLEKGKISCRCWQLDTDSSVSQPIALSLYQLGYPGRHSVNVT